MGVERRYEDLSDLEKIRKQWHKLSVLHSREEWSAAVVGAATAAEIATNFAVRREFATNSSFPHRFINSLLRWANGLSGKVDRLLIPLRESDSHKNTEVNVKRNDVVHQGEFCNENEAKTSVRNARAFIIGMLKLYDQQCDLTDHDPENTNAL